MTFTDLKKLDPTVYLEKVGANPKASRNGSISCRGIYREDKNPSVDWNCKDSVWLWTNRAEKCGGTILDYELRRNGARNVAEAAQSICEILGLLWNENEAPYKPKRKPPTVSPKPEKRGHTYTDAEGNKIFQIIVEKFPNGKKKISQRQPDPSNPGKWFWNLEGIPRPTPLYRLPQLNAGSAEKEVWLVEGEKDVDSLTKLGETATCNAGGAGKWHTDYNELFKGRHLIIAPDNDEAGRKHAELLSQNLTPVAASIKVIDWQKIWPDMPEKADITDALEYGLRLKDIRPAAILSQERPVESVENVENKALPKKLFSTPSTFSTSLQEKERIHPIPENSILTPLLEFARIFSEAPDSFALAAVLCLVGKQLTPRVWMNFAGRKFPNLFNIVIAPPGLRKSTSFEIAERIATHVLKPDELHSGNASDSALFAEFEKCPHKLQIEDEGNQVLRYWSNQGTGRELAARYLKLHDGKAWRQTFKNQAEKKGDEVSRLIECTSLSFAIGGTPNIARFSGLDHADGLRRRFGYYVANQPARTIYWPESMEGEEFEAILTMFSKLNELEGEVKLTKPAILKWVNIQDSIRTQTEAITGSDTASEAHRSTLSEAPSRILKLAMIFEACQWAHTGQGNGIYIQPSNLNLAYQHQLACIEASKEVDSLGKKAEIAERAEGILATIRAEKIGEVKGEWLEATKTQLTSRFAANPNRPNSLTTTRFYGEIIPALERLGQCQTIPRHGKPPAYAFKLE